MRVNRQSIPAPGSLPGRCMVECGIFALHHASSPYFHTDSPGCLCLHAGCRMYLIGRLYSAVGYSHSLFFRCPFAQQLVQDDSREGRRTDAAESKVTYVDNKVTCSHRERNCHSNQVTTLCEIDSVLYPDAPAGGCDETKEGKGKTTDNT